MRSLSKKVIYSLLTLGLGLIMLGTGGTWGKAYGQTAGPTPTPGGVISPVSISKTVNPNNGLPNDLITFSIQVRNNETQRQTNVVVTDRILDFLEIVSVTTTKGTVTTNGQDIRVDIGTLEPGETVTITITVRIRPTAQPGDTGINVADVTSSNPSGTSTSTTSNPVAISVGQAPPSGLPNTSSPTGVNIWLSGAGLLLVFLSIVLLISQRRRVTK
ncbi:MAG TPA: hypothetical protein VD886_23535 [Herpetosiphonaceae bacterium]|nr:hypothetical protein [Herpetosiphonaceae bacterium]